MPSPPPSDNLSPQNPPSRAQSNPASRTFSLRTSHLDDIGTDDESRPSKSKKGAHRGLSASTSRTGQACDRCKNRKIRCDDTVGKCLPCTQNNSECKTTDRNTNRAYLRGHTETLERENAILHQYIWELQQQLKELGVEPKILTAYPPPPEPFSPPPRAEQELPVQNAPDLHSPASIPYEANFFAQGEPSRATPSLTPFANAPDGFLSTADGTSLSVFGQKLELKEFATHAAHQPDGARSFEIFLRLLRGPKASKQVNAPDLGSPVMCSGMIEVFFDNCNPWHPILHPPDVIKLKDRIFTGNTTTAAEKVIVHMILAYIKFQRAIRGTTPPEVAFEKQADAHFHYALTMVLDLFASRTLQDIQALCMICLLTRAFTDSLVARTLLSWTLSMAIDLKLHRSADSLPADAVGRDVLTIETRKRVFWTLLMLFVPILGKLGMPMPLSLNDIDIEMPRMLNDDLVQAEPGYGPKDCRYFHAIAFFKITRLYIDMFETIYCVMPSASYERKLKELEGAVQNWKDNDWPKIVKGPVAAIQDFNYRIIALWMKLYSSELLLLLHHPSRCPYDKDELYHRNIEVCIEVSCEVIQAVVDLWKYNTLDTAWITNVSFFAAIFTYLFCLEQTNRLRSSAEMATLKGVFDSCLEVIVDLGNMLGSGSLLKARTETIIDYVIDKMHDRQLQRAAFAGTNAISASIKSPAANHFSQHHLPTAESNSSLTSSGLPGSATDGQPPGNDYGPDPGAPHAHAGPISSQHPFHGQMLSPSDGYGQPVMQGGAQYQQYDPYGLPSPQYQSIPPGQHEHFFPPNGIGPYPPQEHIQSMPQGPVWGSWMDMTSDGSHVPRSLAHAQQSEPATALMSLGRLGPTQLDGQPQQWYQLPNQHGDPQMAFATPNQHPLLQGTMPQAGMLTETTRWASGAWGEPDDGDLEGG